MKPSRVAVPAIQHRSAQSTPTAWWHLICLGLLVTLLTTTGCLSLGSAATPEAFDCNLDPRLVGTWKSGLEMSQLGPAGFQFRVDCACRYRVKARVFLFMTIRERGPVWADPVAENASSEPADGVLIFGRASGQEMRWPYRFDGNDLLLEEEPGTWTRLKRSGSHRCQQHR